MLRVAIIRGDHDSHIAFRNAVVASAGVEVVHEIVMNRPSTLPAPPADLEPGLAKLWQKHFRRRDQVTKRLFVDSVFEINSIQYPVNFVKDERELNSVGVSQALKKSRSDIALIFGSGIIREPLLGSLPKYKINLHLGLIPYYKGMITMFWPQYFLEPAMAGCTYHVITDRVDVGCILHQVVPTLERGDGIHDVSAKACLKAFSDLERLLTEVERRLRRQRDPVIDHELENRGKMFFAKDFHASQLRVIYELFDDNIVDYFLDGRLRERFPTLKEID